MNLIVTGNAASGQRKEMAYRDQRKNTGKKDTAKAWLFLNAKKAGKADFDCLLRFSLMVGVKGFEPSTPCTPCKCATRLRHTPTRERRIIGPGSDFANP